MQLYKPKLHPVINSVENNEPKSQLTCVLTHACRPIVPSAVTEATLVPVLVLQQMFAPGKHSRSPSVFAPLPVCRHHLSHHPHVSAAGSDYMFVPHCLGSPQLRWGSGGTAEGCETRRISLWRRKTAANKDKWWFSLQTATYSSCCCVWLRCNGFQASCEPL